MPQQLLYTSAPRGLVAGRSGHCTVARSAALREALMLQLEKLSYYQHLSLSGGQERPIYCYRLLDLRSSRYHVLTRLQDAGLDFTGRTNFLAHHLLFTPEEIPQLASPPVILRDWPGWVKSWPKEPQLLEHEDWSGLAALSGRSSLPAKNWQQVTGDAVNGYGLLETRAGLGLRVDNLSEERVLALLAESLELLELRDPRQDFRLSAWHFTFTTSLQEQDNPPDFHWRCLHSDNPAANRFAGPDCPLLSELRALRPPTEPEALLARSGRQPPRFVLQPANLLCPGGQPARFRAQADGIPPPAYQWFAVARSGTRKLIPSATDPELVLAQPPFGVSRYVVCASNSQGEATSAVVTLSVEQPPRPAPSPAVSGSHRPATPLVLPHVKTQADISRQRQRLEAEQGALQRQQKRKKALGICVAALALLLLATALWWNAHHPPPPTNRNGADLKAITSSVAPQTVSASVTMGDGKLPLPPAKQPTPSPPKKSPLREAQGALVTAASTNRPVGKTFKDDFATTNTPAGMAQRNPTNPPAKQ